MKTHTNNIPVFPTAIRGWFTILLILAASLSLALAQPADRTGTLTAPTKIPIMANGAQIGAATAPAGTKIKVLKEEAGKLLVSAPAGQAWVDSASVTQDAPPAEATQGVGIVATPPNIARPATATPVSPTGTQPQTSSPTQGVGSTPPRIKEGLTAEEQAVRDEYWNARFIEKRPLVGWISHEPDRSITLGAGMEILIIDEADAVQAKTKKAPWLVIANQFYKKAHSQFGKELALPNADGSSPDNNGNYSKSIKISNIPPSIEDLIKVFIYVNATEKDYDEMLRRAQSGATIMVVVNDRSGQFKLQPSQHPMISLIPKPAQLDSNKLNQRANVISVAMPMPRTKGEGDSMKYNPMTGVRSLGLLKVPIYAIIDAINSAYK